MSESLRSWADRSALFLSAACAVHCLLLPVAIALLPALATLGVADESFHAWMVVLVLPISVYALGVGWRRHRNSSLITTGLVGVGLLVAAVALGHDVLGEIGEKAMTLSGAALIALAHWRNFRLCH